MKDEYVRGTGTILYNNNKEYTIVTSAHSVINVLPEGGYEEATEVLFIPV